MLEKEESFDLVLFQREKAGIECYGYEVNNFLIQELLLKIIK